MSKADVSLKDWKFNQAVAYAELVTFIVIHELPFSLVEYPKFRSFVDVINPWFKHVSRTTIRSYCIDSYEEEKPKLSKLLNMSKTRISLTADM
jgi:hypothetical protein